MTDQMIVSDQIPAIRALRTLADDFGHLPAAKFAIEDVPAHSGYGMGISVSLHGSLLPNSLGAFEQWREALGIDTGNVDYADLGLCQCLEASVTFAGVPVRLVGYGPALGEPRFDG